MRNEKKNVLNIKNVIPRNKTKICKKTCQTRNKTQGLCSLKKVVRNKELSDFSMTFIHKIGISV